MEMIEWNNGWLDPISFHLLIVVHRKGVRCRAIKWKLSKNHNLFDCMFTCSISSNALLHRCIAKSSVNHLRRGTRISHNAGRIKYTLQNQLYKLSFMSVFFSDRSQYYYLQNVFVWKVWNPNPRQEIIIKTNCDTDTKTDDKSFNCKFGQCAIVLIVVIHLISFQQPKRPYWKVFLVNSNRANWLRLWDLLVPGKVHCLIF